MVLWGWIDRYWIQRLIPLETSKSRWYSLGCQTTGYIKMSIVIIREICYILPRVCQNFPWYSISTLWRAFPVNGSAAISYFSYVESLLKGVSTFINFTVDQTDHIMELLNE